MAQTLSEASKGYMKSSSNFAAKARSIIFREDTEDCNTVGHASFSVNIVMAGMILLAAALAPVLDSWLATIATTVSLGGALSMLFSFFELNIPWIHVVLSTSPTLQAKSALLSRPPSFEELYSPCEQPLTPSLPVSPSELLPPRLSDDEGPILRKVSRGSNDKSSIHEYDIGKEGVLRSEGHPLCVLLSESSKVLSQYACVSDYMTCYAIMRSVSETILQILNTLPEHIRPPFGIEIVTPRGLGYNEFDQPRQDENSSGNSHKHTSSLLDKNILRRVMVIPDDLEHTKSEWHILREKPFSENPASLLRVLTSRLSHSVTKWPIVCSMGTLNCSVDAIYQSVARSDLFSKIDEFCGNFKEVEYLELASGRDTMADESPTSGRTYSTLQPSNAPVFIKYQEMKSVWPVQPRDYLAAQSGFDLVTPDKRTGKMIISKSVDPYPSDPHPEGQEGFVRGCLTASAFIIIQNKEHPNSKSDLWTFLHCDMRGHLSGNGKIADFITQSQMPKLFSKLEQVTIDHVSQKTHFD